MKRLNPDTGSYFKTGDKRPSGDVQDGKIFFSYGSKISPSTSYRYESWITQEVFKERLKAKREQNNKETEYALEHGKKRTNPDTGEFFKSGDKRPYGDIQDGKLFWSYQTKKVQKVGKDKGYFHEVWAEQRKGRKRINPETGMPYKKGDVVDGKRFVNYKKRVGIDGHFYETWKAIKDTSKGIKRLNSDGKPFKRGDKRDDGSIFFGYRYTELRQDGTFGETWVGEDTLKANKLKLQSARRRINPNTGYQFKKGDIRDDGMRFLAYDLSGSDLNGFFYESWINEESFLKIQNKNNRSPHMTIRNLKRRAEKANIPFNLDVDFLIEIFPDDNKCPILDIEFQSGHNSPNSPSVDRIIPKLGYTKGNVIWISRRANAIKNDATVDEIYKVADFYKDLLNKDKF